MNAIEKEAVAIANDIRDRTRDVCAETIEHLDTVADEHKLDRRTIAICAKALRHLGTVPA